MTDRAPRIFDNNIVLDFPVPPLDVRQRIVSAAFLNAAACCEARLASFKAISASKPAKTIPHRAEAECYRAFTFLTRASKR